MPGFADDEYEEYEEDPYDDEEPTITCRYCKKQIHEQSVQCPHCRNYLSEEDEAPSSRKPWWMIIGALLCLYAIYRWIAG